MEQLLQLYIYIPLFVFVASLFMPRKKEALISIFTMLAIAIHLLGIVTFIFMWAGNNFTTIDLKHVVLFKADAVEFFINFYFDEITAVYASTGAVITLMVSVFSRYYMHRDEGFKRFYNTVLFFYLGYSIVIFSGNFETLFIGWEILGITSFLLIAFYRDRYLPVKNGLKVISLYRLGDVCLILAMWMAHHVFQKNITFAELNNGAVLLEYFQHHYWAILFISLMIVVAVAAKSAQLPFSSWLPRAMEGPTTSSAIFYGSLSVNLGAFLLQRTFPLWSEIFLIKLLVIAIGLVTSIIASGIAKVQSSVKTQIAYSSITQIGIILIEIGLGLHILALLHFAGNAFLRTYQLLVSPSVLSYLIHDQFYSFTPRKRVYSTNFTNKIKNTFYLLSLKEWHLDSFLYRYLWSPFKAIGKKLGFVDSAITLVILAVLYLAGLTSLFYEGFVSSAMDRYMPMLYSLLALLFIVKAFTERGDAIKSWLYIFSSQLFVALSICLNEHVEARQVIFYLSGIVVAAIAGYICLRKIKAIDNDIELNRFHGYCYEQPGIALIFLISCLGLLGFPFTPTFIGIDLLFTHIHANQLPLIICTGLGFLIIEISVLRIYARIFLGQHKKVYHPVAFRSS